MLPNYKECFKKMGVNISYIEKSLDDPKKTTVMFQGSKNVLYDIFINPETKTIFEASGLSYEGIKITRWVCKKNKNICSKYFAFEVYFTLDELSIINSILFFWNNSF